MAEPDFDIDSLADYLHLIPQKVARLADRGKLPGRKVGGVWRFSRAEIHHWLEERMGTLDENELTLMEDVLERAATPDGAIGTISEMLAINAMAVPLAAKTRDRVISLMIGLATDTGLLWDPDKMAEAVRAREQLQPTAMPGGIALLHPRRPMTNILAEPFLALGRTVQGIPFGDRNGGLTDIFFLICSTDDQGHLRTLARLSRMIGDGQMLSEIREAPDAVAVHAILTQREEELTD